MKDQASRLSLIPVWLPQRLYTQRAARRTSGTYRCFYHNVIAHLLQAIAVHGARYFYGSLLSVGLLYHLYNQVLG